MRRAVFGHMHLPDAVRSVVSPGVPWGNWHVPTGLELAIVAVVGVALLGLGVVQFRQTD
jgi:ABC-2 type transport system permease protein